MTFVTMGHAHSAKGVPLTSQAPAWHVGIETGVPASNAWIDDTLRASDAGVAV